MLKAINHAKQYTEILDNEIDIIIHAKRTLVFNGGEPWKKKGNDSGFDVTMGSLDGAETCELVRPVYTGNFCRDVKCDFLLLKDVKEYISKEYCHRLTYILTFINDPLFYIHQKEKVAVDIAAKFARVNGPVVCYILSLLQQTYGKSIGLYRDDGLGISTMSAKQTEKAKQHICKVFSDNGLRITIEACKQESGKFLGCHIGFENGTI